MAPGHSCPDRTESLDGTYQKGLCCRTIHCKAVPGIAGVALVGLMHCNERIRMALIDGFRRSKFVEIWLLLWS